MQILTLAFHVGYAALTGAVFSTIAPRRTAAGAVSGALFGLGVWATSYVGWLPVSGVRQPITYDPVARTGLMIAAHLAWGAAAGLVLAATASRAPPPPPLAGHAARRSTRSAPLRTRRPPRAFPPEPTHA